MKCQNDIRLFHEQERTQVHGYLRNRMLTLNTCSEPGPAQNTPQPPTPGLPGLSTGAQPAQLCGRELPPSTASVLASSCSVRTGSIPGNCPDLPGSRGTEPQLTVTTASGRPLLVWAFSGNSEPVAGQVGRELRRKEESLQRMHAAGLGGKSGYQTALNNEFSG